MAHLIARSPDVLWRHGPDVILARDLRDREYHLLELAGGAAMVWLALDQPATAEALASKYGVTSGDVAEAVAVLDRHGLIVEVP
jgi:hypothetical protein